MLPVHDVAEDEGIPFLVMRYTDSGDLASLIATAQSELPEPHIGRLAFGQGKLFSG
jgi:hypothetical protein